MKVAQRQSLVVFGFAILGALGIGALLGILDQPLFVDVGVTALYALGCVPGLVVLARQQSSRTSNRADGQDV